MKKVKQENSEIDILINNAGTILRKPAVEHPDKFWDKVIEVNQTAQFILTREIGKEMVARGSGKVIFTASLLTFQGGITVPGYAASKGAIGQLTKAFANEWASKGILVNAIAPGNILQIIQKLCGKIPSEVHLFYPGFLLADGGSLEILKVLYYFSNLLPETT